MVNHFQTCLLLTMHIYCQTTPIFKKIGQFENLVFVIMSTSENIRLIARTPFMLSLVEHEKSLYPQGMASGFTLSCDLNQPARLQRIASTAVRM